MVIKPGEPRPPHANSHDHKTRLRVIAHNDTVDTFIAWSDEILNWHCTGRPSNGRIEGIILWSVSEGVVDVADGHVAGCRGRVLWSVSLASAMLLAV